MKKQLIRAIDIFLRYLKSEGFSVVFGIPGGLLHPFFEAVEADDDLRLVVTKHEEGAAFMADGFARTSGKISVCAGTSGPGATNLLTGVACAFADGVPMIVLTGQAASHALGKGAAQETGREDIDIVSMFRPVTKYSAMIPSAASLPQHTRRALRLALTGRPGPVHLNVPVDFWAEPVHEEWFDPQTYRPNTNTFNRTQVKAAAQTLVEAHNPVILAGSGVAISKARSHVVSLAELLPARVATTPRAKGIFPEDHPLSLGVMGFAGHKEARETILGDAVDVLLTVGASLGETTTLNWSPSFLPNGALLQVDVDADRIGRNYPVTIPLVGDAQVIMLELIYHLHRTIREGAEPKSRWRDAPALSRSDDRYLNPQRRTSSNPKLTPERWRSDLQEVLPADCIIYSDIGGHMLFNIHHLCIRGEQSFNINLGFGSMGHGTVAPVGAALAEPSRPVVSIVGDGCFTMNGMELIVAAENHIRVVWIVENNNMHGITWHGSQLVGNRQPLDCVKNRRHFDIAQMTRAMGITSWTVDGPNQMQHVFTEALKEDGPAVIEVMVDESIAPPLGDRAKSVAGFVKK